MPKIYYKCCKCHKITTTKYAEVCSNCGCIRRVYTCQHNYWWELLYLKLCDITRIINNFVKQWAKEKFNKEDINTEFGYEGLLILAKCLDGRSKVKTENGYKRINWIYRNNYKGKVYSLDNKGKLILSKIKEVYKNSLNNRKL